MSKRLSTSAPSATWQMARRGRLRGWDRKLATTSNRSGDTPGGRGRSGRSNWSTAVMSTHWVNCSSSRSHRASSSHSAAPMCRTGWPWECSATAAGNRSTAAASTSSPAGTGLSSPGSLCVVSRAASSDISEWWGAAWSRRLGDGLVDVDAGTLTGPAHDLTGTDELVQREDAVDEGLGTGGTSGHVDVDGNDLVDALDDGVVVEHAAAAGADAHGDDPLGFDHLVVDLAEHGRHLLADPTGHDHQVGLAGAGPEDLHTEAAEVVVGRAGGHHLDGAAGQAEGGRPHRVAPGPLDEVFDPGGEEALPERLEAHQAAWPFSPSPGQDEARSTGWGI